jgi:hypothetical protein
MACLARCLWHPPHLPGRDFIVGGRSYLLILELETLLGGAVRHEVGEAEVEDVYAWREKLKSENRQQPLPHTAHILALQEQIGALISGDVIRPFAPVSDPTAKVATDGESIS